MKERKPPLAALGTSPEATYVFGPFRLDSRKRRLWKESEIVPLTPKGLDILLALVRQAGHLVEKDDLMKAVWPDTFVGEETLTQNISTLRKALGDTADQPDYIATVPRRGYQFISQVAKLANSQPLAADAPLIASPSPQTIAAHASDRRSWFAVAFRVVVIGGLLLGVRYLPRAPDPRPEELWPVIAPGGTLLASAGALSPDGQRVAFVTTDQRGVRLLQVQAIGSLDARTLPGTEGARDPFWSPDSRSVAFFAGRKLKRTNLLSQDPQTVAEVDVYPRGGTWSGSGVIVFPGSFKGPLHRVDVIGGPVIPVTKLNVDDGERAHVWPCFLPDGRSFLYRVVGANPEHSGTYIGSLDSDEKSRVLDGSSSAAIYAPPGYLIFVRDGSLVAQRFDAERRVVDGPLVSLAANVAAPDQTGGLAFSAAQQGVVSFLTGGHDDQLEWFDRAGRSLGVLEGSTNFTNPALSPDGSEVLAMRLQLQSEVDVEIWLASTAGGTPARFHTGLPRGGMPLWSPDGASVVFTSTKALYHVPASGPSTAELLLSPKETPALVHDWSPDGRFLIYLPPVSGTGWDLWLLSLADRSTRPFLHTSFDELQPQVSPDGRWIAYTSNESGTWEVYVQPFPAGGSAQKVSLRGGAQPRWRRTDGRELFYLSLDHTLMSVDVRPGSPLRAAFSQPRPLFDLQVIHELTARRNHYAVSNDGRRFLVSSMRPVQPPITILRNWATGLRR
jgi:eukaryotic-like serine/threonine-protein kinase